MQDAIELHVRELIVEVAPAGQPLTAIHTSSKLQADLGFDSLAIMELVVALENSWSFQVPDFALIEHDKWFADVQSVIRLVRHCICSRA
jgi:acyl carrier protein